MCLTLSVADAHLKADGERVRFILYDGRTYVLPIKNLSWQNSSKDKVYVSAEDVDNKKRRFMIDFSKARR